MKRLFFLLIALTPVFAFAQKDSVASQVYMWKQPGSKEENIASAVLLEGPVYNMPWLQVSANRILKTKKKIDQQVPADQELLLLVKSGLLTIRIKDSTWSLVGGSIALLMPGEKYSLQTTGNEPCSFYTMKYRSVFPVDMARGNEAGGSIVRDWTRLPFIPQERGGRRNYFERPTAMSKRFEMHVTTLKEGLKSHDPHRHGAKEIIIVIEGDTEMLVGDKNFKGSTGDLYYLGSNILHGITNIGKTPCTYFAFQFE